MSGNGTIWSFLYSGGCCQASLHDGSCTARKYRSMGKVFIYKAKPFYLALFFVLQIFHPASPLQGYCGAGRKQADCAVMEQESDPGALESLEEHGCGRGPRSDYCHSQSGAGSAARAGGRATHGDGLCKTESP